MLSRNAFQLELVTIAPIVLYDTLPPFFRDRFVYPIVRAPLPAQPSLVDGFFSVDRRRRQTSAIRLS